MLIEKNIKMEYGNEIYKQKIVMLFATFNLRKTITK